MKNTSLTLLLLIGIISSTYSQNSWESSYIIDHNGDTTYGYIDYSGSRASSQYCKFRTDEGSEIIQYTPKDINAYRISDANYFVSKVIDLDDKQDTVFLEFLFKGEANIYHYTGDIYFIEADNKLYELKNSERVVYKDGREFVLYEKEYIGVLTYLMKDAQMQNDITNATLDSRSLIRLAKKYHETVCDDANCFVYKRSINPVMFKLGLLAGITYNKINFGKKLYSDYSIGYSFGVRLALENISTWTDRISLVLSPTVFFHNNYKLKAADGASVLLEYEGDKYYITTEDQHSFIVQPDIDVSLKIVALNLPLAVQYAFVRRNSYPYVGFSIVNMFVLSQNDDFKLRLFYTEFGKSIPTYHLGGGATLGYKFRINNDDHIIIESNYQYTTTLNVNQTLRMTTSLFSLNLTYVF